MIKLTLRILLHALFRVEIRGELGGVENERTLIVANHDSFIDGLLLCLLLPRATTFVVHTASTENRWFARFLRFVPHLAVDPARPMAIRQVVKLVEQGKPVVIFPEGRITRHGSLLKVYDGAALLAARTGATIVPVRVDRDSGNFFGRLAGVQRPRPFSKVNIAIGARQRIALAQRAAAGQRRRSAALALRGMQLDLLVKSRPGRTLWHAFLDAAATFGAHYAPVEDIRLQEESYQSLLRQSLGMARLLAKKTERDEVVGLLTPSAAPTLGLVLALSAIKRVPALLNYTAGPDGLAAACHAAKIRTIVASRSFLEKAKLTPLVTQLPGVEVLFLEDFQSQFGLADKLWVFGHLLFPRFAAIRQKPEDAAVVIFTSGSEGKPKGVVHSHSSLLSNVAQIRAVADFTPLDKFMMALPLFHSFGLTCGVLLPLVSGCKVFLYPNPLHYKVIPEIVNSRNCTVLFGTSTFLGNYAKHASPSDFERLRYVIAGAERLADEVHQLWLDKFGIRILEGYGVTECGPVVAVNVPGASRVGSVGQLMPGMQHELEPVPGIERGGTLQVQGPNLMKGYLFYDTPGVIQQPSDAFASGWYSTGDIVEVDDEGFIHIRGRLKRFAKIAGEMVSLEVVEKLAATAAAAFMHAASTRSDAAKGEALVLFTTAPNLARDVLLAAARQIGAPELAVPRLVKQVEAIPLLGTGKIDYLALKRMAESLETNPAPALSGA